MLLKCVLLNHIYAFKSFIEVDGVSKWKMFETKHLVNSSTFIYETHLKLKISLTASSERGAPTAGSGSSTPRVQKYNSCVRGASIYYNK